MSTFNIPNIDKVVHFSFYTIFTGIWLWSVTVKVHRVSKIKVFWVLSGAIIFGFVIELLQKYTTATRSFEWLDVLANTLGAITGTIIFLLLHKWTHKSQTFV